MTDSGGQWWRETAVAVGVWLVGTLVVFDARRSGGEKAGQAPRYWVYNGSRAQRAYSPASTFKLPHTLFAQKKIKYLPHRWRFNG